MLYMKYKNLLNYREYFAYYYQELYSWVDAQEIDGVVHKGFPEYHQILLRFINDVYDSGLLLKSYKRVLSQTGVKDYDLLIQNADETVLRAILTHYVRDEHSNAGLWGRGVRKMCFLRILDRLEELLYMNAVAA